MFAPNRIERGAEGDLIILGEAVGGIGTSAAGIRWADSLWVPFWELGYDISYVWPVDAPEARHVFVGVMKPSTTPNYLVVGEVVGSATAYLDSVALLGGTTGYSAAASPRRRWAVAYGADTGVRRVGHVYYSDGLGEWHEAAPSVESGDYGTAVLSLNDSTALVAFASINEPYLRVGTLVSDHWDESFPEPTPRGWAVGAPRFAHRADGGFWLIWVGIDSLYVAGYRDGTWGPTQGIHCIHDDPVFHGVNSTPYIGPDPNDHPVMAWAEYNTRTGVQRVCVCVPTDQGFPSAEEILEPNGTLPVVLRDENGDVWLAWYRYFGGMYWQHTYVTATATDFAVGGHAGARRLTWNLTEPAPKSRWAVLRASNDGPFEVAGHLVASGALTMSWTDSSPPAGVLRYKLRRECLDVRFRWESPEVRWPIRSQRPIRFTQVSTPLTPGQIIELSGAAAGTVFLELFDVQGRVICQRRWQATGSGIDRIPFDAGRPVGSGVYFLRAVDASGGQSAPARIVLLR